MYRDLERYTEAEPLYLAALSALREIHGPAHTDTLRAMNSLAILYQETDRYDDAERMLREILDTFLERADPGHPNALAYRHNLGVLLRDTDRPEAAAKVFEENLPLSQETLGPAHRGTIFTTMSLAETYDGLGESRKADRLLEDILDASTRLNGEGHIETLRILDRTIGILLARGDTAKALAMSERLLRQAADALPSDDLSMAPFHMSRAEALERAERFAEAIESYEKAYTIYAGFHGEDHRRAQAAREAVERLADL